MKRGLIVACAALSALPLAGCADDYGYGGVYSVSRYYPDYGWYDGYYGPVYDGYWGTGDTYYYRLHRGDRWRRDDDRHFRYGRDEPGWGWRRYHRADRDWHGRGRGHGDDRDRD